MYNKILIQTGDVLNETIRFNIVGVDFKQSREKINICLFEIVLAQYDVVQHSQFSLDLKLIGKLGTQVEAVFLEPAKVFLKRVEGGEHFS